MEILNVSMGQAVHCFKWGWIQQKVPFSKRSQISTINTALLRIKGLLMQTLTLGPYYSTLNVTIINLNQS